MFKARVTYTCLKDCLLNASIGVVKDARYLIYVPSHDYLCVWFGRYKTKKKKASYQIESGYSKTHIIKRSNWPSWNKWNELAEPNKYCGVVKFYIEQGWYIYICWVIPSQNSGSFNWTFLCYTFQHKISINVRPRSCVCVHLY